MVAPVVLARQWAMLYARRSTTTNAGGCVLLLLLLESALGRTAAGDERQHCVAIADRGMARSDHGFRSWHYWRGERGWRPILLFSCSLHIMVGVVLHDGRPAGKIASERRGSRQDFLLFLCTWTDDITEEIFLIAYCCLRSSFVEKGEKYVEKN